MHAHGQRHENQERLPPPVRAVAGHVVPYISRGEEFNPPSEDADYPAWVGQTWCEYLYVWTADRGWEVASVPVVDEGERADLKFEDLGAVLDRIAEGGDGEEE